MYNLVTAKISKSILKLCIFACLRDYAKRIKSRFLNFFIFKALCIAVFQKKTSVLELQKSEKSLK